MRIKGVAVSNYFILGINEVVEVIVSIRLINDKEKYYKRRIIHHGYDSLLMFE